MTNKAFLFCLLACWWLLPAAAQEFGRAGTIQTEGTAYHLFARPGEATVQVFVLGDGGSSGIYELGVGTDLGRLYALTGGVSFAGLTRRQRRRATTTVRLWRETAGQRSLIYEQPLETMLTQPSQYPVLQENDIFSVEQITPRGDGFGFRDGLSLVTTTLSIIILIERLTDNRR